MSSRLPPWLPPFAFFLFLAHLGWVFWRPEDPVADPGTGWHIKLGELLWQERSLPAQDPLSYTAMEIPWIDYQWLTHALMGALFDAGGVPLITAFWSVLFASVPVLLYRQCLREHCPALPSFFLSLWAYLILTMHLQDRPHVFTYLFVALLAGWMREVEKNPGRCHILRVRLPLLFVLWSQMHAGFLAGLLVFTCYSAGILLQAFLARRPGWQKLGRDLALAGSLAGLATFLNPYGWNLHLHILKLLQSPIASLWNEYQSPFLHNSANIWLFYALAATLLLALFHARKTVSWGEVLCNGILLVFACKSVRHINLFVLTALPVAAKVLASSSEHFWNRWTPSWRTMADHERALGPTLGWCSLVSCGVLFLGWIQFPAFAPDVLGPNLSRGAVQWLREHPEERGPLFNSDNLGGSLAYAFGPEWKVFVDDRLDLYGTSFFQETYIPLARGEKNWEELLDHYHIQTAVFSPSIGLFQCLDRHSAWEKCWSDEKVVIFRRRNSPDPAD